MYRHVSSCTASIASNEACLQGDATPLMGKAEHPQVEQQMIVANDIQIKSIEWDLCTAQSNWLGAVISDVAKVYTLNNQI